MAANLTLIDFTYELKTDSLSIHLMADVEQLREEEYLIKNIRKRGVQTGELIPPIVLQKLEGIWVHKDSRKETHLSEAVGKAIERSKSG
ncbi:MAG TPA: hypothetical protein VNW04_24135 [Puia sp.]|jgi:hypothetical protein|nr:hypothetical protein [Puia sp.]